MRFLLIFFLFQLPSRPGCPAGVSPQGTNMLNRTRKRVSCWVIASPGRCCHGRWTNRCYTCGDGLWGPIPPACLHPHTTLAPREGCGCFSHKGEGGSLQALGDLSRLFACAVFLIFTLCVLLLSSKVDFALKLTRVCSPFHLQFWMEASQTTKKTPNKDKSWKCVMCRKLKIRHLWLSPVSFLSPPHKQACSKESWCSQRHLVSAADFNTTSDR